MTANVTYVKCSSRVPCTDKQSKKWKVRQCTDSLRLPFNNFEIGFNDHQK